MALFLISYDLKKPDKNYKRVHEALRHMTATPILESVWFVRHEGSAAALLARLRKFFDGDDALLVAGVSDRAGTMDLTAL